MENIKNKSLSFRNNKESGRYQSIYMINQKKPIQLESKKHLKKDDLIEQSKSPKQIRQSWQRVRTEPNQENQGQIYDNRGQIYSSRQTPNSNARLIMQKIQLQNFNKTDFFNKVQEKNKINTDRNNKKKNQLDLYFSQIDNKLGSLTQEQKQPNQLPQVMRSLDDPIKNHKINIKKIEEEIENHIKINKLDTNSKIYHDLLLIQESIIKYLEQECQGQNLNNDKKNNFLKFLTYLESISSELKQIIWLIKITLQNLFKIESNQQAQKRIQEQQQNQQISQLINANQHLKIELDSYEKKLNSLANELEYIQTNHHILQKDNHLSKNRMQEIEKLSSENLKLLQLYKNEKQQHKNLQLKDQKIMKLLNAIRLKGFDVERTYREEVMTPDNKSNIFSKLEYYNLFKFNDEIDSNISSDFLDCSLNYVVQNQSSQKKNEEFHQKLKLNLEFIEKNKKEIGFHQEFMGQINEFSQSWRQAAQNEQYDKF